MVRGKRTSRRKLLLTSPLQFKEESAITSITMTVWFVLIVIAMMSWWASRVELDEVSLAPGEVLPQGDLLVVQHIRGGLVTELRVSEGDYVKKGDVLLVFDNSDVLAEMQQIEAQLETLRGRKYYLEQEYQARKVLVDRGLNSRIAFLSLSGSRRELEGRIHEVQVALENLRKKRELTYVRAPTSGSVHNIRLTKRNAVVGAGKPILDIVPGKALLIARVRIRPRDIGHVVTGQPVMLKFSSYNFAKYGGMKSKVTKIAPTTLLDQENKPYYLAEIPIVQHYLRNDRSLRIIPGMTLQADIKTGSKSLIEYLLKPIFSSAHEALRER